MVIEGSVHPPLDEQNSSRYAGRPTSVGLYCLSPRNSSIWLKRFVANDESSTVAPIARVQVPVYDHWYRERSAEWIRSAGSVAAYVQSLTYSRNVMPLVRKKKRSFEEALKSSRKPYCWLFGESGSPPR